MVNSKSGPPPISCVIRRYNGRPTVHINGNPIFPSAYLSDFPQQFRYRNMYDLGIRIFGCQVSLGDRWVGLYKNQKVRLDRYNIWQAPGKIDFDIMDESIKEILEVAPEAYVLPRINCNSPSWWDSFHPAETCRTYGEGLPQCQSFSSLIWREETAEVLREIVRHVQKASYADRFIGMHICAGETTESVHLGWQGDTDYSIVAEARFKEWLLKKYGNEAQIVKHFDSPLHQISIPSPEARNRADFGDFFDPQNSRLNIDYRFFRADEIVDSMDFLCRAVKEESQGHLLTGTFYGHTFAKWLDHMSFHRMLQSPYVDFFTSTTWGTPVESIKQAGKLFYNEGDEKTNIGQWISETRPEIDPYHEYDLPIWKRPGTLEQTLEHLKSEFAHAICSGTTIYWYDLFGGWYDNEKIMKLFGEACHVANSSIHRPSKSASEICVFIDERSLPYVASLRRQQVGNVSWLGPQKAQLDRLGAPYDLYLLDDLENLDMSPYKLVVFLNSFVISPDIQKAIIEKCITRDHWLLWLYGPGLLNEKNGSDHTSKFIRMPLEYEESAGELLVHYEIDGKRFKSEVSNLSPFIYLRENEIDTIWGATKEGKPVLGVRASLDSTIVWATAPPIPWQILRHLAQEAGVHIYSHNGDVVYCNQGYLAIKSSESGTRSLTLPHASVLKEVLVSANNFETSRFPESITNKTFKAEFSRAGDTRLYQIDPI